MYVRCDESSLYSRINYVQIAPTKLLRECPGIIKTMHTGFSAYTYYALCRRPQLMEETGRYDLAWKDLCSVLNALSK